MKSKWEYFALLLQSFINLKLFQKRNLKKNLKVKRIIHGIMCNDNRMYKVKTGAYAYENNLVKRLSERVIKEDKI